jgi:hypothetical protein
MKTLRAFVVLGILGVLCFLSTSQARAQWHYGEIYSSGGWPGYSLHGYGDSAYRSGRIPTPPYFAIHPPVYYGRRVSMPYGNSPLTRPPRPVTEVVPVVEREPETPPVGLMVWNPYVVDRSEAATQDTSTSKAALIKNPHVSDDSKKVKKRRQAAARRAAGGRRPQQP